MRADVGVIGGTGVGDRLLDMGGVPVCVPTAFGSFRGTVIEHREILICLISRHSVGHKVAPQAVNYRAFALGLRALGAKSCLATAAVGCLREDWPIGTLLACSDFIDCTSRNLTLFDRNVIHTDFTTPFGQETRSAMIRAAADLAVPIRNHGVYLASNGPRYETPAEIQAFRQAGAEVVGMTATSEAIAMKEAGIDYGCLAIVTNRASGMSASQLNHQEVVDEMSRSGDIAMNLLLEAATILGKNG